jgi:hypothetical protein
MEPLSRHERSTAGGNMHKTLKVLAALGILGCVSYAVAQTRALQQGAEGGGPGQIASKEGEGKFAPANGAQKALREYFMAINNRNVLLANNANKGGVAQSCTDVQCYYFLTTMKPDERKHEIDDVWQVSKFRPNGQWNHITSAPMLVNELLRIDKKTNDAINVVLSNGWNKWMQPFMEQNERVAKKMGITKKWDDMTPAEQSRLIQLNKEEHERWLNGRTTADVSAEHAKFVSGMMQDVRKVLNKNQLAEFDKIIASFDRDISSAFNGVKNVIGG